MEASKNIGRQPIEGKHQKEIRNEKEKHEIRKHGEMTGVLLSDKNPKLEWMYKNSSELLNRNEYLLGKAVDRNFEELDKQEKEKSQASTIGIKSQKNHIEHNVIPVSIREYKAIKTSEQVDLQRKILEDPLMAIRQKEMESRRKILQNPVKLKELHKILKKQTSIKRSKKKSKKSKKSSNKKKKKESSPLSETSDEDLDKLLVKQIKEMKNNASDKELKKILDCKYNKISKELDKAVKHKQSKKKISKKDTSSDSEDSSINTPSPAIKQNKDSVSNFNKRNRSITPGINLSSSTGRNRDLSTCLDHYRSGSPIRKKSNYIIDEDNTYKSRADSRSSSRQSNPFKNKIRPLTRSPMPNRNNNPFYVNRSYNSSKQHSREGKSNFNQRNNNERSVSRSPQHRHYIRQDVGRSSYQHQKSHYRPSISPKQKPGSPFKIPAKLSEEEKQKRLQEMAHNAKWRDDDRTRCVKKYREDYKREEDKRRDFDKNFVSKQVHKVYNCKNSVESRLNAHRNHIQRSAYSMNTNFVRK